MNCKGLILITLGLLCFYTASYAQKATLPAMNKITFITLDPGHFHAALVQKVMYPEVNKSVFVYAPEGAELQAYARLIHSYNNRATDNTAWEQIIYTGTDYLERMLREKKGNVIILAGNNGRKINYIKCGVEAGFNVLSDKPMAIDAGGFEILKEAFKTAEKKKVLLYDIMTERYEINSILQKELSMDKNVFGVLQKGTADNPAILKESVHHFFKYVSGAPLVRPGWYYDVRQQGEGLVDVTTHLVDLVQWVCFPGKMINYKKDINILSARHWTTPITAQQFKLSTGMDVWPAYLLQNVNNGILNVHSNGEMNYTIRGIHTKVSVIWNFQAPDGTGDTHLSIMKGSRATLYVRQGKEQKYKPELYIEPTHGISDTELEKFLIKRIRILYKTYPGISISKETKGWRIIVPDALRTSHEAQFAQVATQYLDFLKKKKMPNWEVPNMLAKYYTTTQALNKAIQ